MVWTMISHASSLYVGRRELESQPYLIVSMAYLWYEGNSFGSRKEPNLDTDPLRATENKVYMMLTKHLSQIATQESSSMILVNFNQAELKRRSY